MIKLEDTDLLFHLTYSSIQWSLSILPSVVLQETINQQFWQEDTDHLIHQINCFRLLLHTFIPSAILRYQMFPHFQFMVRVFQIGMVVD